MMDPQNSNALDLDSESFSTEDFVKRLIGKKTLNDLIEKENELKKDIRSLDNDMQSLVYENYNKFIGATELVQKLKVDFSKVNDMLLSVSNKVNKIEDAHKNVLNIIKPKHDKIRELRETNEALNKMQYLFDLPSHLEALVQEKCYNKALNEYNDASKLLIRHENLDTFKDINLKCYKIFYDLYKNLKNELRTLPFDSPLNEFYDLFEFLDKIESHENLFQQIKLFHQHDTLDPLKKIYLEIMLNRCLQECQSIHLLDKLDPKITISLDYTKFADDICTKFMKNFSSYIVYYNILFGIHESKIVNANTQATNSLIDVAIKVTRYLLTNVIVPFYSSAIGFDPKNEPLFAASLDTIYKRFKNIDVSIETCPGLQQTALSSSSPTPTHTIKYKDQKTGKNTAMTDVLSKIFMREGLVPILNTHLNQYVLQVCQSLTTLVSDYNQKLAKITISRLREEPFVLREMVKAFNLTLNEKIKGVIKKLTCYSPTTDISFANERMFVENFLKSYVFGLFLFPIFKHFLGELRQFFANKVPLSKAKSPSPIHILSSSLFHQHIISDGLNNVVHQSTPLALLFFGKIALEFYLNGYDDNITNAYDSFKCVPRPISTIFMKSPSPFKGAETNIELNSLSTPPDNLTPSGRIVKKDCYLETANILITYYVRVRALEVLTMYDKSTASIDWLALPEARHVRSSIKQLVKDLEVSELQVVQLYPENCNLINVGSDEISHHSQNSFSKHNSGGGGGPHNHIKFTSNSSSLAGGGTNIGGAGGLFESLGSLGGGPSSSVFDRSTNLLQAKISKIFSEKVVIYEPVTFNKLSIMTGITKICLKSMMENIRCVTINKNAFQQIQIDTYYLQLYLWRYFSNEKILQTLLDEIISSAIVRCLNPASMDQNVIELICEKSEQPY